MADTTYYDRLGVAPDATEDEIRKAYRRLARELHPDRNPDDPEAEAKFKDLGEAYDVLKDPEKRKTYDRGPAPGYAAYEKSARGRSTHPPFGYEDIPFDRSSMGSFSSLFGDFFGGGFAAGPEPGRDIYADVQVGFVEALNGTTLSLSAVVEGREVRHEVRVPAGVRDNTKLRLKGKGMTGADGAPAGDLIVTVRVDQHPDFVRDEDNFITKHKVSVTQAALGCETSIKTPRGKSVKIRIPEGSQPGKRLRIKGEGAPSRKKGLRHVKGDLLVELQVEVPKPTSPVVRELLERLHDELNGPQ